MSDSWDPIRQLPTCYFATFSLHSFLWRCCEPVSWSQLAEYFTVPIPLCHAMRVFLPWCATRHQHTKTSLGRVADSTSCVRLQLERTTWLWWNLIQNFRWRRMCKVHLKNCVKFSHKEPEINAAPRRWSSLLCDQEACNVLGLQR